MDGSATHQHKGRVQGHAITISQMPAHNHRVKAQAISSVASEGGALFPNNSNVQIDNWDSGLITKTGGGETHDHAYSTPESDHRPPSLHLNQIIKV